MATETKRVVIGAAARVYTAPGQQHWPEGAEPLLPAEHADALVALGHAEHKKEDAPAS